MQDFRVGYSKYSKEWFSITVLFGYWTLMALTVSLLHPRFFQKTDVRHYCLCTKPYLHLSIESVEWAHTSGLGSALLLPANSQDQACLNHCSTPLLWGPHCWEGSFRPFPQAGLTGEYPICLTFFCIGSVRGAEEKNLCVHMHAYMSLCE